MWAGRTGVVRDFHPPLRACAGNVRVADKPTETLWDGNAVIYLASVERKGGLNRELHRKAVKASVPTRVHDVRILLHWFSRKLRADFEPKHEPSARRGFKSNRPRAVWLVHGREQTGELPSRCRRCSDSRWTTERVSHVRCAGDRWIWDADAIDQCVELRWKTCSLDGVD